MGETIFVWEVFVGKPLVLEVGLWGLVKGGRGNAKGFAKEADPWPRAGFNYLARAVS